MSDFAQYMPLIMQAGSAVGGGVAGYGAATANQRAAKVEAQQAIINSQLEAQQSQYRNAQILAKQRAMGAAAGVDISSGTPMAVYMDSVKQAELERLTILAGGKIQSQRAKYGAYQEGQRAQQSIFTGLGNLGTALLKNKSVLGDLFSSASGSSGWAASVTPGTYSINAP